MVMLEYLMLLVLVGSGFVWFVLFSGLVICGWFIVVLVRCSLNRFKFDEVLSMLWVLILPLVFIQFYCC
jgi:NADH:ubiquinone oxidoreductase subunit H